jgi:hypothetical protein
MATAAARVDACAPACASCTPFPRILPHKQMLTPYAYSNHKLNRAALMMTMRQHRQYMPTSIPVA